MYTLDSSSTRKIQQKDRAPHLQCFTEDNSSITDLSSMQDLRLSLQSNAVGVQNNIKFAAGKLPGN